MSKDILSRGIETKNMNPNTLPSLSTNPDVNAIQQWLVNYLAEILEIEPGEIYITVPFDQYGLNSSVAVGLTGELEEWLNIALDPTLLYDYPTVKALAQKLAETIQSNPNQ
jgi:acyl carrier protein